MKSFIKYICYDAGGVFVVEKFNDGLDWHKNEFLGTLAECKEEKERLECSQWRFKNCLPHESQRVYWES